jgi:polar amino acid transport system permease protein
VPLATSAPIWHKAYAFALAVFTFAIVFGAFAANVIYGAMQAVPRAQLETAEAYGMTPGQVFRRMLVPQMWVYALPGLSNLWMILIKATPLLFLLGIQDIVYWARELGGVQDQRQLSLSAWRLAAVVFPGAAGLLPCLHPRVRNRHGPG